jgi:hypothetical protein
MKKIFSYILIALIVVQLFAPFSIRSGTQNNIKIENNKAEAMWGINNDLGIALQISAETKDTAIKIIVDVDWSKTSWTSSNETTVVVKKIDGTQYGEMIVMPLTQRDPEDSSKQTGFVEFTGLTQETDYKFDIVATQETRNLIQAFYNIASMVGRLLTADEIPIIGKLFEYNESTGVIKTPNPIIIKTLKTGSQNYTPQNIENNIIRNEADLLPECQPTDSGTWGGCIGKILYWAIFKPTSVIFGLTGRLLDISVDYSTKDTSYKSEFVIEGWGIIRDMCNMFFIFILLYIAFGTILKLHGVNPKEMIVNVVIIGLLINFSLFAVHVIIDASNMLTRVFYNPQTIVVGPMINGVVQNELGSQGEIKLSEAIVGKINPQKLILNAGKAGEIKTKQDVAENTNIKNKISATTFILVTFLASIVNIVGIIVFLTASLIFITRVIGLWLAMIFAPLAFFSYTVPALQDMEFIGWKKWWPETIKMAFLAPVFVFFLYLIIKFLETGLGLNINNSKGGMDFILGIFVPFIFIMILLMKAKDIAKDMSGKMGQTITNGLAAFGGLALGGAALGGAALGRNLIGKGMAAASRTEGAKSMMKYRQDLKDYKGGKTSVAPVKPKISLIAKLGDSLNKKQEKVGDIGHARHEIDETKKAAGLEGVNDSSLSGVDKKKIEDTFKKNKKSDVETMVRRGVDAKGDKILIDGIEGGENAYKAAKRKEIADDVSTRIDAHSSGDVDAVGNLTDQGKKKVENELNVKLNDEVKKSTDKKLIKDFEHVVNESKESIGMFTRGIGNINKASFDFRNISQLKSDKRDSIFSKVPTALIAGVASGVRMGLKNGMGVDHGTGQKDFVKDLTKSLESFLKEVKVEVKVDSGHKEQAGGHDAHGGGHGGGHH